MKSYEILDEESGEVSTVTLKPYEAIQENTGKVISKILYRTGKPVEYRFNGQTGTFQQGADKILTDEKGKNVKSFSFIPVAWRMFEENLFANNKKDNWVELFFVDDKSRLSHLLLRNSSYNEFTKLDDELFYENIKLNECVLTLEPFKIEAIKSGEKVTWFACKCTIEAADAQQVQMLKAFVEDFPVFAERTLTATAVHVLISPDYRLPVPTLLIAE